MINCGFTELRYKDFLFPVYLWSIVLISVVICVHLHFVSLDNSSYLIVSFPTISIGEHEYLVNVAAVLS